MYHLVLEKYHKMILNNRSWSKNFSIKKVDVYNGNVIAKKIKILMYNAQK